MGRGTLGTSRGIAAATSTAAPTNSRPAAIQQHLVQAQRYIAREVNSLTPPRDGSWAGIANQNKQARVRRTAHGKRRTANGYEAQLFTHGDDNVHEGLFDNTREGLKKARRAIRGHLGV